jgi:hypothetical protein
MIGHKRSSKTRSFTVGKDTVKAIQKIIMVGIVEKNLSSVNALYNDMVERSRGVYTSFSRHAIQVSDISNFIKRKSEERPLSTSARFYAKLHDKMHREMLSSKREP